MRARERRPRSSAGPAAAARIVDTRRRPRGRAAPRRASRTGSTSRADRAVALSRSGSTAPSDRRRRRAPRPGPQPPDDRRAHASRVVSSVQGTDHLVEVDGVAHRFSRDDAGIVRAPAAALVVAVDVAPGDVVEAGDRLGGGRGDEDGDRRSPRRSPAGSRDVLRRPQRAGRRRGAAGPHRASSATTTPTRRPAATVDARPGCADRGRSLELGLEPLGACEAFVLGFDVEPPTPALPTRPRRRRLVGADEARADWRCSTRSPTSARWRRERARGRQRRRARRRASTSTPTCARSTSSARACRRGSATACCAPLGPLRRDRASTRRPSSRRRCCGSSSPSSGAPSRSRS